MTCITHRNLRTPPGSKTAIACDPSPTVMAPNLATSIELLSIAIEAIPTSPKDTDVPEIGEELATAHALSGLAHNLGQPQPYHFPGFQAQLRIAAGQKDIAEAAHGRVTGLGGTERRDLTVFQQQVVQSEDEVAVG
jgi:hypothetical protein